MAAAAADMNMDNNKNQVVKNIRIVAQRWTSSGLQWSLLTTMKNLKVLKRRQKFFNVKTTPHCTISSNSLHFLDIVKGFPVGV